MQASSVSNASRPLLADEESKRKPFYSKLTSLTLENKGAVARDHVCCLYGVKLREKNGL